MKIVYSSEARADVRRQLGSAHYSYGFTAERYVQTLRSHGTEVDLIANPEIFNSRRAYVHFLRSSPSEVIHVSFRSTENIRLMAGAYNVVFFYWEFPVLRDRHLITEAVTSDQLHMLRLADEVWVSCEFTASLFRSYGLSRVYTVAPPMCSEERPSRLSYPDALQILSDIPAIPLTLYSGYSRDINMALCASRMNSLGGYIGSVQGTPKAGNLFLTVCNPGDSRKNLLNVIDGFRLAATRSPQDLLVLKLIVSNVGNFRASSIYDVLYPRFKGQIAISDPRIVVVFDFLESREMDALYSVADFYLSGSHCEGLNLPLAEAMTLGTVPVSTVNTAMVDYLRETNSVQIRETSYLSPVDDVAANVAGQLFQLPVASRIDIADAIGRANRLTATERAHIADACWDTISSEYSGKVIYRRMTERFDAIERSRLAV